MEKETKRKRKKKKKSSSSDSASSNEAAIADSVRSGDAVAGSPVALGEPADHGEASQRDKWMTTGPAVSDFDFFSRMGSERKREEKLKPDPEKTHISEREYNPFLRGEESNLPAPEATKQIPKEVLVGDGGNDWRRRAARRAKENADGPAKDEISKPASGSTQQSRLAHPSSERTGSSATAPSRKWQVPARAVSRSRSRSPNRLPENRSAADDSEDILQKMRMKYGRDEKRSKQPQEPDAAAGTVGGPSSEDADVDDPNKLGALAMEAMLSGDMARYEELNARLAVVQAKQSSPSREAHPSRPPASDPHSLPDNVRVIEEVDAAGRNRSLKESVQTTSVRTKGRNKRGTANAIPGKGAEYTGYFEDDNVSLDDLIRRERIEGVQDYDANFAAHIAKKGGKFKMLNEDEDEAYALGWYEQAGKKMDANKRDEKQMRQNVSDKMAVSKHLENCTRCTDSKKFGRKDAVISTSENVYLCMDGVNQCIVPQQVFIAPLDHVSAATELDDAIWTEIRNYQHSLVRFYEAQDPPKAVLFGETALNKVSRDRAIMGGGPHMAIVAYPVEKELVPEMRAFWTKAMDEVESEFEVQHKRVVTTESNFGARGKVPKGFSYVHVDFSLTGGCAHVIENPFEFPRDFIQNTVAGICELTVLDRAYPERESFRKACDEFKKRFAEGFDWIAKPST